MTAVKYRENQGVIRRTQLLLIDPDHGRAPGMIVPIGSRYGAAASTRRRRSLGMNGEGLEKIPDRMAANLSSDVPERLARRTGLEKGELAFLRQIPLFAGLTFDQLALVLADSSVRRYVKGAVLFLQDDPADRFFVIFEGWVKLFRQTADGQESVIALLTRGESFAEAAIFEPGGMPVTAVIAEDARLLVVPADCFAACIRSHGELALNILASMSRHMRRLIQQVEQLAYQSTAERVASFLYRLCGVYRGSATVRLPFEKSLVAAKLNMQPETFSRALARLRKIGVRTRGLDVFVADVATLRQMAGRDVRDCPSPLEACCRRPSG